MAGSGQVRDEALGEHWEQSLVGVTGAAARRSRARRAGRRARVRDPYLAARQHAAADSNRLRAERRARRRLAGPAVVLGAGLVGCTAVLAMAPARAEATVLACPADVAVSWVDQYRDVLGLRVPDPRDHVEVAAAAGSTVEVTFVDADGARYPTVRGEVSGAEVLTVEPPRPVPAGERASWRLQVVVSVGGVIATACAAALS